jgi:hypothetical protein
MKRRRLGMARLADEFRLASPLLFVQRALFAVLALVGKLLGYRRRYPEHGE